MKWFIIFISALVTFGIGMFYLSYLHSISPEVIAQEKKNNEADKWYKTELSLAQNTTNATILKSIYLDALKRGADPSYADSWGCCDYGDPTWIWKYAHAKYEGLK